MNAIHWLCGVLVTLAFVSVSDGQQRCTKMFVDSTLKITVKNEEIRLILAAADEEGRNLTANETARVVAMGQAKYPFRNRAGGPGSFRVCPGNPLPGCSASCFSGSSCSCIGSCCQCCCEGTGNGQVARCFNIFTILGLPDPKG